MEADDKIRELNLKLTEAYQYIAKLERELALYRKQHMKSSDAPMYWLAETVEK